MQNATTLAQKRDVSVDIIKGLGIVLMVAGHSGTPVMHFIYLFHMAIFFIASGYCYKPRHADSFSSLFKFIKRKFQTLWFPYVLWTVIYSCLHNFFIRINIYTDNPLITEMGFGVHNRVTPYWSVADIGKNILKSLFLKGSTQLGGAFWFIAVLMELSVLYCVIDFIIRKLLKGDKALIAQGVISVIFLAAGYVCFLTEHKLFGLDKVLSYYFLFYGGHLLKHLDLCNKVRGEAAHLITFAAAFGILLGFNFLGTIALDHNSYVNPAYFFVVSFAGWQFLYEAAHFIKKVKPLQSTLTCAGQNTMAVVVLHFLCFKLVSFAGIFALGDPLFFAAAFPVLYRGGVWWIAYLAVGLIIPVCLSLAWKKLKKYVIDKKKCSPENARA